MKRATALASLIACMLGLHAATASEVTGLVTFTPGAPARAAEVNGNFNAVKSAVDDNHARIDTLQSGAAALDGRVAALENTGGDVIGRLMYGDGSAGDLVLSGIVDWRLATSPTNLNFNNCTIQSGTTLTVSGGTVIRCAGTFVNNGRILVEPFADGGFINVPSAAIVNPGISPPQPGDLQDVPGMPAFDTDGVYSSNIPGADGGRAAPRTYIIANLARLRFGGGGGGGSVTVSGGDGGGLLRILVNGAISNIGRIDANAGAGAGGGGGGIVILASRTSISNSGTISVQGGYGIDTTSAAAAGAGGGGGIVVLVAPSIDDSGTLDVSGGEGGNPTRLVNNAAYRAGGGGGGGSGGVGGSGGSVTGENGTGGFDGSPGYVLTLQQDPLFVVH